MKTQTMTELEARVRKVARGAITASAGAALARVEPTQALIRLLTPDDRSQLHAIGETKP